MRVAYNMDPHLKRKRDYSINSRIQTTKLARFDDGTQSIEPLSSIKTAIVKTEVKVEYENLWERNDQQLGLSWGTERELDCPLGGDEGLRSKLTIPDVDSLPGVEVNNRAVANNLSSTLTVESMKLKPCLEICEAHCNTYGCENIDSCDQLHICKQYVLENCQETDCALGHRWDTGHNSGIIRKHFSGDFPAEEQLKSLTIRETSPKLSLCENYNVDACFFHTCPSLHICKSFFAKLVGDQESGCSSTCPLSHDILDSSCIKILSQHNISTNETRRDIALSLISKYPLLCKEYQGRKKSDALDSEKKSEKCTKTVWSHHYNGDVEIPEICYKSVTSSPMCPFEKNGCKRLHSNSHFHWQISEGGTCWRNMSVKHVKCLERSYCDPSKDDDTLPRLDPATLENPLKDLINIMGRDSWSVDFKTMKMTNSQGTHTLYLRRLYTEEVTNVKLKPANHVFYFLDQNNKWVLYGNTDTLGNGALACNISSEVIEKHYTSNPGGFVTFHNSEFNYILDFSCMLQKNVKTGKCREVKRRPEPHLEEEQIEDYPESWKISLPQHVYRVVLSATSADFQMILCLLNQKGSFSYRWIRIERIMNIYLWRAYQNKVMEMSKTYGSETDVNVQLLFHGTTPQNVDRICHENFDWRLNGSSNGRMFGWGSYFTNVSTIALNYSKPDTVGHRYIFVAAVAVGKIAIGDKDTVKPPINQQSQLPYDSTVNNIQDPTIIVKYDKQEYYPEYLITFA